MPRLRYTQEEFELKFWERVDKTSDPQGCWLWNGARDTNGYGCCSYNGKTMKCHKITYILRGLNIPNGLDLAHSELCKGKKHCCNPEHIRPKTKRENQLDKFRDGTMNTKLNDEKVVEILTRRGELQRDLALEFEVSESQISCIMNGKSWTHLTTLQVL
jgi:hypothetical protein